MNNIEVVNYCYPSFETLFESCKTYNKKQSLDELRVYYEKHTGYISQIEFKDLLRDKGYFGNKKGAYKIKKLHTTNQI